MVSLFQWMTSILLLWIYVARNWSRWGWTGVDREVLIHWGENGISADWICLIDHVGMDPLPWAHSCLKSATNNWTASSDTEFGHRRDSACNGAFLISVNNQRVIFLVESECTCNHLRNKKQWIFSLDWPLMFWSCHLHGPWLHCVWVESKP